MLLTTNTVTESNRDMLRILMAGFYLSSERSRALYSVLENHAVHGADKKKTFLEKAWSEALEAGPPERKIVDALHKQESDFCRHYNGMAQDNRARFFSHLNEFVQHLKILPHNPALWASRKHALFAGLPATEDFQRLKTEIRDHFPEVMKELRHKSLQDLILAEFTPAKVSYNVVPIRPDIIVPNELEAAGTEDPPAPPPPEIRMA